MDAIVDPAATVTETETAAAASVQHVTKRSSDELLRKFAELGEDEEELEDELEPSWKRRRSGSRKMVVVRRATAEDDEEGCESPSQLVVERRSLLAVTASRKKWALLRRGRGSGIKNNKSILLATIEKTWRRTLEGASRLILEKQHCNRHRRLINDVIVY